MRWQFLLDDDLQGTYREITNFREVDVSEWDAVVTEGALARRRFGTGPTSSGPRDLYEIPRNLYVFGILRPNQYTPTDGDIFPDLKGNHREIRLHSNVPGSQFRASGAYLGERIVELVKQFVPIAEKRDYQFGLQVEADEGSQENGPVFRSFILGPADISLMGSYRRVDGSGVWLIPYDVPDFQPWWEEALREWHTFDSERFPGFPGWIERDDWKTVNEQRLIAEVRSEEEKFAALATQHEETIERLQGELDAASTANAPAKQLLTGTGTPLQDVVRDVLRDFGYTVREMDKEFPEREPREDFRITEPDYPSWLVIADATGVAKGAKGAKLQTLSNYVIQYLAEEGNAVVPKQWLLINRLIDRDPLQRGSEIFRADVLRPFEAAGGLAIETPALFVLHRALEERSVSSAELRDLLRDRTGELSTESALRWLNTRR